MLITITNESFNELVIKATKPVVLDFFADWCGPCRQMAPGFEELSNELSESYVFGKVDVDENRQLAITHGITSIPTLIFYKNGRQVGAISGALSKKEIAEKLIALFGQ